MSIKEKNIKRAEIDDTSPKHIRLIKTVVIPLLFFFWGMGVAGFQLFPYSLLAEPFHSLQAWLLGSREGQQLSFTEKLSDLLTDQELRITGESLIGRKLKLPLKPVRDPKGLMKKSVRKLSYYSIHDSGYYVIFFIPSFSDAYYGAIILSAEGEIKRVIKRPKIDYDLRTLGQGGVSDDGKLIFNSYFELYVTNLCGDLLLEDHKGEGQPYGIGKGVGFHHKASSADGYLWAWYGNEIRQYDLQQKKQVKNITLEEIISANAGSGLFEARLIKSNLPGSVGQWKYQDLSNGLNLKNISLHDPFHQNDVDVLSQSRSSLFPQFAAGDLLLSFRSINLVVAIDPKTLKVKWSHFGDFSRQHDPDWAVNGEISVYDNQSHGVSSRIISINPNTHRVNTLIDGQEWGFYQFAQGNHQLTEANRVLFTNDSEMAHATSDRLDFYFKYESSKGRDLDIGTVHYFSEIEYLKLISECY